MPRLSEDWLAAATGGVLLAVCLGAVFTTIGEAEPSNPLKPYLAAPAEWVASPAEAFADGKPLGLVGAGVALLVTFGLATRFNGPPLREYLPGLLGVMALALLAYVIAKQKTIDAYSLGYMLWAILIGLAISNTIGTPEWMRPALRGELYTKVGLVLLGSKVLFSRLLELGPPGVAVAWVVTPVVLCTTFWFGRRVLKIPSPSLSMVVAADMSVCGVSAAIATAAACRAKKEELSLAIGLSMLFTVVMMIAMPAIVLAMGLSAPVGGAWIGGTVDSTGAVAAAGEALGEEGLEVATTIKMIQNILVGVTAFGVAAFWVTRVECDDEAAKKLSLTDAVAEVWRRFPKFILGFLGASVVFSLLYELHPQGHAVVGTTITGATNTLRNWCFCLAFTAIGLEVNFRQLAHVLRGGKPLVLYVCGQSLNVVLTLAMATLVFGGGARREALGASSAAEPSSQELAPRYDPSAIFYSDHPAAWGRRASGVRLRASDPDGPAAPKPEA